MLIPKYTFDLGSFVSHLRIRLFSSLKRAAHYFSKSHSTISRYENGVLRPPLGYVAGLIRLYVDRLVQEGQSPETIQNHFIRQINKIIRYQYELDEAPLHNWVALCAVADEFIASRQVFDDQGRYEIPIADPSSESAQHPHCYDFVMPLQSNNQPIPLEDPSSEFAQHPHCHDKECEHQNLQQRFSIYLELVNKLLPKIEQHWEEFTPREKEVVQSFSSIQTAKLSDIGLAKKLGISRNTLRKHIESIYRKLNINNRASLAIFATQFMMLQGEMTWNHSS